jgi:hypothetical protein
VRAQVTASNSAGSASATSAASAVVQAAAAPPPAGSSDRFGLDGATSFLSTESDADFTRDMGPITGSGAKWLRIDINWGVIQRHGRGTYDWVGFDRIVQNARDHGMNVLGIIDWTPGWANSGNAHAPPTNMSDYTDFASVAVKRYAAMGVHAYEIWNEENLGYNWGGKADAAGYVQMLKAVYPVIHAADPQATVLVGGFSPATDGSTDQNARTYLQAMYANGAKGYFDAVADHPYCFPDAPGATDGWSTWYQMYGTSTSLRSIMIANGDGDKKIWGTEFGYPTNGPSGTFVSEAQQSTWITLAYQLWASYTWAGPLFIYVSRDQGTSTSNRYNFYGLLRYDFSAKPAYAAFQAAVAAG